MNCHELSWNFLNNPVSAWIVLNQHELSRITCIGNNILHTQTVLLLVSTLFQQMGIRNQVIISANAIWLLINWLKVSLLIWTSGSYVANLNFFDCCAPFLLFFLMTLNILEYFTFFVSKSLVTCTSCSDLNVLVMKDLLYLSELKLFGLTWTF